MSKRAALIIGGLSTLGAAVAALFVAKKSATATKDAIDGISPPMAPGGTNTIKVHLTHYYPFEQNLNAAQRKMEGNPVDATGAPLYTVEDFLAGKADYVSLAGDLQGHKGTVWPYGQKLLVPWGDKTLVGRVTDTGGHFHGLNKMFRVVGAEPIDVCVFSSSNHPPKSTVDVQVVVGDHFAKASAVAQLDKAGRPQTTSVGGVNYVMRDYPGQKLGDYLGPDIEWAQAAVDDAGGKIGAPGPHTLKALYTEEAGGDRIMLVFQSGDGITRFVAGTPAPVVRSGLDLLGADWPPPRPKRHLRLV